MKSGKFWIAVLVAGVVAVIFDFVAHGIVMGDTYKNLPDVFNQGNDPTWFIVGDFIAVFVFAWFYDKVYASFGGGMKGGATYGFYAGVLVSFPTWIFIHLMIAGFPYGMSWTLTLFGVAWGVLVGTVLGAMYKK